MHCKTCDYPLWNITSNKCPECGEAYRPSDYEFVPNSVRFCCPHCQQTYYGTGFDGHLVPKEFACVNCSNQIHMDQMVLLPAEGVEENWTKPDINPWIERKSRGLFRAWFASVSSSLVRPSSMMKSLGDAVRVGEAWKFALLNLAIILSMGIGLPGGIIIFFQFFGHSPSRAIDALGSLALGIIIYALIYILGLLLWAALTHGILRLTKNAKHTFGKTTEAILYSSGVMAITAVPLVGPYCGNYVTIIWWIVCAVIMVTVGHKAKGGRSALSVLTFPAIVLTLLVATYVGVFYFAFSRTGTAFSTAQMQAINARSTSLLTMDLITVAQGSNGKPPEHAILLLENPDASSATIYRSRITSENHFVGQTSITMLEDIPVGDITLEDFQWATQSQRQAVVKNVLDSMPDNVIAHRFGDYVFTYHGADFTTADPKLWVVVYLPDPDTNGVLQPYETIEVGLVDLTTHQFTADKLTTHLQGQNKLRAKMGLPPLPDLTMVTHANPAVADSEDGSD